MKRSEMVQLMTDHWLGLWPDTRDLYGEDIYKEVYEKMSTLLATLEYKGMKPPVRQYVKTHTLDGYPEDLTYYSNDWEDE